MNSMIEKWRAHVRNGEADAANVMFETITGVFDDRGALLKRAVAEHQTTYTKTQTQLAVARDALAAEKDRHDLQVRQLVNALQKTGSNQATAARQEKLVAVENSLAEKQIEVSQLGSRSERLSALTHGLQDDHEVSVTKYCDLLVEKCGYESETSAKYQAEVKALGAKCSTYDQKLADAEDEYAHESGLLKERNQEVESELANMRLELEDSQAVQMALQQDLDGKVLTLQRDAQENELHMADQSAKLNRVTQEFQAKLSQQSAELEATNTDHRETVQKLKSELRQKDSAIDMLQAEKETIVSELSTKVDAGEAEAAVELRANLRAEEVRSEGIALERDQLRQQLAEQEALYAEAKNEFLAMTGDLKRIIAQKDTTYGMLLAEKDEEQAAVVAQLEKARARMNEKETDNAAALSQVETELHNKARKLSSELDTQVEQNARLAAEAGELREQATRQTATILELKAELERTEAGAARASAQIQSQGVLTNTRMDESERTIAALRQETADKSAALAQLRDDYDDTVQATDDRIAALENAQLELQTRHEKELDQAISQLETQLQDAETRVLEQEQMIGALKASLASDTGYADSRGEIDRMNTMHAAETARLNAEIAQLHSTLEVAMAKLKVAEENSGAFPELVENPERDLLRRQLDTLAKPIRAMGRQSPGPSTRRNDGADVDLLAYIETAVDTPQDVLLTRFNCKGFLSRLAGKHWQDRWMVFDLKQKTIAWYTDEREMKISVKGTINMIDIVMVESRDGFEFELVSKKRSIFLRAPTPEAKICWELCFNAIAKTAKKINQESVA